LACESGIVAAGLSFGCCRGDFVIEIAASFVVVWSDPFFAFNLRLIDLSCDDLGMKCPLVVT
jgi:hypothetical protein